MEIGELESVSDGRWSGQISSAFRYDVEKRMRLKASDPMTTGLRPINKGR